MGIGKNGYYRLDDILKYKCVWNIIYGDRAKGKSFAPKERALEYAWKTQQPTLAYIRRNRDDIAPELICKYFEERGVNLIEKVTNKEYNMVDYYKGYIHWARLEDGKIKRGARLGEAFALSLWRRYKSTGHPYLKHFIVEEVLADRGYVKNEPEVLQNLVSTLARQDEDIEVYMIGNLISRVCPYFTDWSLKGVRTQKPGTIDIYTREQSDGTKVRIAVEFCPSPDGLKSGIFFGQAEKSIQGGTWESKEYAKLADKYENYSEVYNICYASSSGFDFNLKLLAHKEKGYLVVFVYPCKHVSGRTLSSVYSEDPQVTAALSKENYIDCLYHNLIVQNKIVFANNLCGEDFYNSLNYEKRQIL